MDDVSWQYVYKSKICLLIYHFLLSISVTFYNSIHVAYLLNRSNSAHVHKYILYILSFKSLGSVQFSKKLATMHSFDQE